MKQDLDWDYIYKDFTEEQLIELAVKYDNLIAKKEKYKILTNVVGIFSIVIFLGLSAKLLLLFFKKLSIEELFCLGLALFAFLKINRNEKLALEYRDSRDIIYEQLRKRK